MESLRKKLVPLNLENQYTYLNRQPKKTNALAAFIEELHPTQRLPSLDKKYLKTVRNVEKELQQVENLIHLTNRKQRNPLSQQRYLRPNIMPIYIPMPMTIPINMQMSTLLPQVQQPAVKNNASVVVEPTQIQEPIKNQQKTQPDNKKQELMKKAKDINKFPEKSKINRFRVYAYVVYFSIYFKYFSRKFTELRRNWFNQRYAINDGKIIYQSSTKILKHLYEVDLYKMLKSAKQRVKDIDLEELNYQKSGNHSKNSDSVLTLIHFVTLLIDYAREYMTDENFIKDHHQVFTVGVLTQNFMLTNLYLPQEAALLHIHQQGYILVEEETEVILLMLKIIVKIFIYNYLLGLKYSRQWNTKQEKSYGLDDADMDELWSITRHAGIFLTIVCEQIYDKTFKEMSNPSLPFNFNEMSPKFNVFPAKTLEQAKRSKQSTQSNPNDSNSKLISNLQGYADMQTLISLHPALKKFKDKIKLKIIDFLTVVYTSLKYQQAKVYDFLRYMTLDENYLILKGVKYDLANKKKKKKKGGLKGKDGKDDNNTKKGRNSKKGKGNSRHSKHEQGDSYDQQDDENGCKRGADRNGNQNSDQSDQDGSDNSSNDDQGGPGKKKKKRLRFKHEQAFYDHKFEGHNKLEKLKRKMAKK